MASGGSAGPLRGEERRGSWRLGSCCGQQRRQAADWRCAACVILVGSIEHQHRVVSVRARPRHDVPRRSVMRRPGGGSHDVVPESCSRASPTNATVWRTCSARGAAEGAGATARPEEGGREEGHGRSRAAAVACAAVAEAVFAPKRVERQRPACAFGRAADGRRRPQRPGATATASSRAPTAFPAGDARQRRSNRGID